jgi:hypothetical protein
MEGRSGRRGILKMPLRSVSVKNTGRFITAGVLFFTVLLLLFNSCVKDNKPEYGYFVSKEYKVTYTKAEIVNLLGIVESSYPEVNEPYATRLGTLFDGKMTTGRINEQLSTSIPELIKSDLIAGFETFRTEIYTILIISE